ncbi:MAG TPA: hypothetical protein VGN11_07625 [Candidatus Baltobacteraceae bacterium]|jgi:hypothetical protein|nr:hypothetical protein [Candidatus Baltobacteraceae bacterium]
MFDHFGSSSGRGGSRRAAADVPIADLRDAPRVFVLGGSGNGLGFVNSFRPERGTITARLVSAAWTPVGVVVGDTWQNVGIALSGLLEWVDRTFPPEDERAFVAPMRDIELLARVQWHAELPEVLSDEAVLNIEDVPEDIAEGLAQAPAAIVQCSACRRMCVRDDFVWKEKQLCAWDFHSQVFGKRGPWRNGPYEERHFDTLPSCAYVAPQILGEMNVEVVFATNAVDEPVARKMIDVLLEASPERPHMAVRSGEGFTVLREPGA